MKRLRWLVLLLLVAWLRSVYFSAPLQANESEEVVIEAYEYSYSVPEQVPAGLVTFRLINRGEEAHQANISRLNDGVTFEEVTAALGEDPGAALRLLTSVGGPNGIPPGGEQTVTVKVEPGVHVLLDFIPSPHDGVPHIAKGMIQPFEVVPSDAAERSEPAVDGTITMKDFTYLLPEQFKAGQQTIEVINDGPQPHEVTLVKLAEGKSAEDVKAFFTELTGPPPYIEVGGVGGMAAGKRAFVDLDLEPGHYVIHCPIPDPASGKRHTELGMITSFTIPESPESAAETTYFLPLLFVLLLLALLFAGWWFMRQKKQEARGE